MKISLYLTAVLLLFPAISYSQETPTLLKGKIVDQQTGAPLGYSYVYSKTLNKADAANKSGIFKFENIPPGTYRIKVSRIGYKTLFTTVTVQAGKPNFVTLKMTPATINLNELTVVGEMLVKGGEIEGASRTMTGSDLRKNMSSTLAATIKDIPGVASRSMGAAPARPVIRGLGGKRVVITQDGIRTGDVSSMSADHAVTIDPIGAEKIEIARGPAALKFGSNAIGGVINVVSHQIPATMSDHIQGNASLQGSTVNMGEAASLGLKVPAGSFALQLNSSFRHGNNLHTPVGEIVNTGLISTNHTLGISYIQPWGYAGGSFSYYLNHYGIPPDQHGGHAHGVDINMRSYQFKGKSEILFNDDFFRSLKIDLSFTNYYHREIEPGGITGTEFGLLSTTADVALHHANISFIDKGIVGIWGEKKNLAVQGAETPTTDSYSFSTYLIEEATFGRFTIKAGARFDYISRNPAVNDPHSSIGHIRERTFTALSGSGSIAYAITNHFNLGAVLFYSFRAPTASELYSEGPHLASYSYEIGNPELDAERALSKELFFEYSSAPISFKVSFYQNAFSNYIFPRNTGRQSSAFPSLNVYKYTGGEANFYGTELSMNLQITGHLQASGSLSYTYAKLKVQPDNRDEYGTWRPLPKIPPLQSNIGLNYHNAGFKIGASARIAAKQSRTGIFETPTPGYTVFDLFAQYKFRTGHTLHTISLKAKNILNETYRSHLSHIKEIMPEPGRNIMLLYRIYF